MKKHSRFRFLSDISKIFILNTDAVQMIPNTVRSKILLRLISGLLLRLIPFFYCVSLYYLLMGSTNQFKNYGSNISLFFRPFYNSCLLIGQIESNCSEKSWKFQNCSFRIDYWVPLEQDLKFLFVYLLKNNFRIHSFRIGCWIRWARNM